jgi:DNA (cytosine-5)-methyltransferase 1
MNELALFSGSGGGILAGNLLGWRTVCAVESHRYAASVLARRQNEGHLEPFPIWDDVCTFDGRPWKGIVDVISGGFPCQDISVAGKGKGIEGTQSGLWVEMARIINEVRPEYIFVENTPVLTSRGLGRVLGDMATMGYNAEWGILGAHSLGAPHKRDRIWIVGKDERSKDIQIPHTNSLRPKAQKEKVQSRGEIFIPRGWWESEPRICRVANGVARRMDRLRTIGNGQVPIVASTIFKALMRRLDD